MNLADYLSELLGQYDEVSVPGLGYFVRERVNGYYNNKEAKFYPPSHHVKFVGQPKDDDTFAQHVADKKKISLASSKYFTEKFVGKLKEQAAAGIYPVADLGSFRTEGNELIFTTYDKLTADPDFYGYAPVSVYKKELLLQDSYAEPGYNKPAIYTEPIFTEQAAYAEPAYNEPLDIAEPAYTQPVYVESGYAEPVDTEPPQEQVAETKSPLSPYLENPVYYYGDDERKEKAAKWVKTLLIILVVGLALFGVYQFFNATFDKLFHPGAGSATGARGFTAVPVPVKNAVADTDSAKTVVPAKDSLSANSTAVKPVATPADTAKRPGFAIVVESFRKQAKVNEEVARFKTMGIDARALSKEEARGPLLKISVGVYPTHNDAVTAMRALIKAGKIGKDSQILELKTIK